MPGGRGRNESAREGDLRAQIFDEQDMSQERQSCQWVATVPNGPFSMKMNCPPAAICGSASSLARAHLCN